MSKGQEERLGLVLLNIVISDMDLGVYCIMIKTAASPKLGGLSDGQRGTLWNSIRISTEFSTWGGVTVCIPVG